MASALWSAAGRYALLIEARSKSEMNGTVSGTSTPACCAGGGADGGGEGGAATGCRWLKIQAPPPTRTTAPRTAPTAPSSHLVRADVFGAENEATAKGGGVSMRGVA